MTTTPKHGLLPIQRFSAADLAELRALADACQRHENLELRLVWNAFETRSGEVAHDFMYYNNGRLVGFLTLEGLGESEAEATGMVHPEYRRRGIFRELVGAAQAECRRAGTAELVFYADRGSQAAKGFAASIDARHEFVEHRMRRDTPAPASLPPSELSIAKASAADAPLIAEVIASDAGIDALGFGQHVARMMREPSYQYYIAKLNDAPVGTANIQMLNGDAYIYGFVVKSEFRGRGYGRHILARMIADIAAERPQPIFLDVLTDNTPALALYHSFGFQITNTFDYYRSDIVDA